uniref:Aurora kinase n=1 Tax=Panagrellus redivivus TaxID=6233 RepID=A0A7E4ZT04_PANRE
MSVVSDKDSAEGETSYVIDDFEVAGVLGKGGFGKVVFAREKRTQYPVALKMLEKKTFVTEKSLKQLCRELELQYHLKHPNILRMHAFFFDVQTVYIVLEACQSGNVFTLVRKNPEGLASPLASYIVDSVAAALEYCHKYKVVHRDLKPENILLDDKGVPKLADFGFCVRVVGPDRESIHGTAEYVTPEMLHEDNHHRHNYKVDNWAVGVLMYELLNGRSPFYAEGDYAIFSKIKKGVIPESKRVPDWAMNLIRGLLTINVKDRMELSTFRADETLQQEVAERELMALNLD